MADNTPARPFPVPYRAAEPYWAATEQGRLLVQRCSNEHLQFYPRAHCRHCGSTTLNWMISSGEGVLHTFSVVHRPGHAGFADRLPYVFGIVELREGPRVTSNIIDVDPADIHIGMPLRVVFTDREQGYTLPQFAPSHPGRPEGETL
jgi:uncharacterized OB-fold protein